MSWLSKAFRKIKKPLKAAVGIALAPTTGGASLALTRSSLTSGFSGSGGGGGGGGGTDLFSSGTNLVDTFLGERKRRDSRKDQIRAEKNRLKQQQTHVNNQITLAELDARKQVALQLAASGGDPTTAFPSGWLPGAINRNVLPGTFGPYPMVESKITSSNFLKSGNSFNYLILIGVALIFGFFILGRR